VGGLSQIAGYRFDARLKGAAGTVSVRGVPGRNDPCPCGSGKKYKRCCAGVAAAADREHRRLASAVTKWAEARYPGTIEASYREFSGEYDGSADADVEFIATWFLHEWELPGGGTPLERYAESGSDDSMRALADQLASAKLNLWRVIEVFPGTSLVIEPFTGGERARIASTNISTVVGPWDLILGRLRADAMELWGPSRCYAASDEQGLRHLLERLARRLGIDPDDIEQIARRSPAELLHYRAPPPIPLTTEGDPVVFVTARWHAGHTGDRAALESAGWLLADPDSVPPSYNWFGSREKLEAMKPDTLPRGAVTLESSPLGMPDVVSLGTFYVDGDEIRYEGFSERRAEWAIEMLEDLLPDAELVDVEATDIEQKLSEAPPRRRRPMVVAPDFKAELRASLTERWLAEPIPALEGLTPRQAAATEAYLPQLRSLLRTVESQAARSGDAVVMDLERIVTELGVTP
jgi:hypothetical protein